tara:strand:+ start:953 stop:2569 length:1617 start_codon:yes stop_codon:yes gene_type:complete
MVVFVSDLFIKDYVGGGELSTQALIETCLLPVAQINSRYLTVDTMKQHKNAHWIFGNFTDVNLECLVYAIKNLSYTVIEYDYKFCKYRSPEKHIIEEGECNCQKTQLAKAVTMFMLHSKAVMWMSHNQKQRYMSKFPFLEKGNNNVLSSLFTHQTLNYLNSLKGTPKNDKYLIINSQSWIKGTQDCVIYAKQNNLEYELVGGLEYKQVLEKLATSKGIIFLPKGGDTCPRFTIEAKILDCELILNDNVQHKDEEWFETPESCLEYMYERSEVFWSMTEETWNAETPPTKEQEPSQTFRIITPFYNTEGFIGRTIYSLQRQNNKNFKCYMIDDCSTDNSATIASLSTIDDKRFELVQNIDKKYALGNIAETIGNIEDIDDEDIIILLDGDDWLPSNKTLSHLEKVYNSQDCLMTYGSYVYAPHGEKGVEPSQYPQDIIDNNSFRTDQWRASHLRTFKHKLWKEINHDDLKNDEGYYKVAYDQAIMLPLLELAAERAVYIPEVMHVYNRINPLNVDKTKQEEQYQTAQEVRSKTPYQRLS